MTLGPGQRAPFHWSDEDKEGLVCVKPSDDARCLYQWSSGFYISEIGTTPLRSKISKRSPQDRLTDNQMFIKAERKLHENTVFLIVQEENKTQPYYKVSNKSTEYEVQIYQVGFKVDRVNLRPGDATPFAWSD